MRLNMELKRSLLFRLGDLFTGFFKEFQAIEQQSYIFPTRHLAVEFGTNISPLLYRSAVFRSVGRQRFVDGVLKGVSRN